MTNTAALTPIKTFLTSKPVLILARIIFWSCFVIVVDGLLLLAVVELVFGGVDNILNVLNTDGTLLVVALVMPVFLLLATIGAYGAAAILIGGALLGLALAWIDKVKTRLRVIYIACSAIYIAVAVILLTRAAH